MKELWAQRIEDRTLVIVSAKQPGFSPNGFEICDDEALVWLSPEKQQGVDPAARKKYYDEAKDYIEAHASQLQIQQLLDRDELKKLYQDPFKDSARPTLSRSPTTA